MICDPIVIQLHSSRAGTIHDPKTFPLAVPLYADFEAKGAVVAKYAQNTYPDAKVGVVYKNDDFGKDYVSGCWTRDESLADCRRGSYELSDPTIDTQSLTDS